MEALTKNQVKALTILEKTSFTETMRPTEFARLMWPDANMHTSTKNTGNGATVGKAAWLCAGSYLAKLRKLRLVSKFSSDDGYFITQEGKEKLSKS